MCKEKEVKPEAVFLSKEFMEFPETLNKKCTEEEFQKMMTSHNSDIPVERVNFLDYPDVRTESQWKK